ncbi:MAG: DUF3240 family protein [Methylococcales bacterium]|nr:DUF3240 family protein [Methylococcales bacterium]
MSKEYVVTLNVPPSLEEMVVDCLLVLEIEQGFSSMPVSAHHHENKGLSIAEQVTGRQKKIRFQMYVNGTDLARLLVQLREDFIGSGIQYWVSPVLENGVF